MKKTIQSIVDNDESRVGIVFDAFVQIMVVLSLLAYSLETLPDLEPWLKETLDWFELVSVVIFSVEYIVRLLAAKEWHKYAFSFFGIIDLIAILPYYIGLTYDLRSMRIFRLLRIFRILKLARYSAAMRRFHLALNIAREELILFLCVTMILLFLSAIGIHYFESEAQPKTFGSVFHCLWWAVATLTTVGYGDVYPVTVGGKIFTFVILIVGLGFISVPAGLVASSLAKARQIEEAERREQKEIQP